MTGILLHAGNALCAASTAAEISSGVLRGTSATASPVAGLYCTSLGPRETTDFPLINSGQDFKSTAGVVVDMGPPGTASILQRYGNSPASLSSCGYSKES